MADRKTGSGTAALEKKAMPAATAPEYKDGAASGNPKTPGLAANKARQGVTGQGVKYVLAFSLTGAVATLLLVYFWVY